MVTDEYLKTIKQILASQLDLGDYQIFLFGSRASGGNRQFSDFDIGILGPKKIDLNKLSLINEKLENSRIPVNVDLVDFCRVSADFRSVAMKKVIYL